MIKVSKCCFKWAQKILGLCLFFVSVQLMGQTSMILNAPGGSVNTVWKKTDIVTGTTTNVGVGATYTATSVGLYYCEFDYKICRKKSDYVLLIDGCFANADTLVKLNANTVSGGTYQWYKDGFPVAGANKSIFGVTYKDTGTFYSMTNTGGCMIQSEVFNIKSLRISCNLPPIASPLTVNGKKNKPLSVNLSAGASDPNGDPLVFSFIGTAPVNATVKVDANGNTVIVPNPGYFGTFTFSYSVCDVTTQIPNPLCDTDVVTVNILNTGVIANPIANDDRVTLPRNIVAIINELANDSKDPLDSLLPSLITTGTAGRGTAVLLGSGQVQYTPVLNFEGKDTVYYKVCSYILPATCDTAMIVIEYSKDPISNGNNPPLATDDFDSTSLGTVVKFDILLNDSDPDGDTLNLPNVLVNVKNGVLTNLVNGNYSYKPDSSFVGNDTFVYRVCDYGIPVKCDTAVVVINVPCPILPTITLDSTNPTVCNATDGVLKIKGLSPNAFYNITYKKDGNPQTANNLKANNSGMVQILNLGRGLYTEIVAAIISNPSCNYTTTAPINLVGPPPVVTGINILCK